MKFFSRVVMINEAKNNGVSTRRSAAFGASRSGRRFKSAFVVALAALSCVGCVGRKQYAINEAILVSERRQLEDEIYRLQFELRDALAENERLRREVGGDAASVPELRERANAAGTTDAFFPGLDASQTRTRTTGGARKVETPAAAPVARRTAAPVLRTDGASRKVAPESAGQGAVETLPEYVPIPVSSKRIDEGNASVAASRRALQAVSNAPTPQIAQTAQNARNAQNSRSAQVAQVAQNNASRRSYATAPTAPPTAGKTFGVRRELAAAPPSVVASTEEDAETRLAPVVPVAASTARASKDDGVVASVFVDSASTKEKKRASEPRSDAAWSPLAR